MDPTEAEDIKKRWQEHTEELYKKDLHDPDNHNDVIQVQFLGWEDPLEEGMATHSNILAWRIPWTEKPGGPQTIALPRVGHD